MKFSFKNILYIAGAAAYVFFGIYAINMLTNLMTREYFQLLATKASDIAKIAARSYTITDKEVEELKALEFEEVLEHPANQRLERLFVDSNFSEDFEYAYIMVKLEEDQIKYYVDESNADYYEAEVGTPLNLLWLADVIINRDEQAKVDAIADYYKDLNRYSYFRQRESQAYEARESTVLITIDEYGDAFTGMVPVFSVENNFVGMMGVDIYYAQFEKQTDNIRVAFTVIFLLPTIILTSAYLIMYIKKHKYGNTEANTDSLTGLFNRRYLNNHLPRLVKEHHQKQSYLSVIMIDIDYFKSYNDHYGHQKGDEVLIEIARAIGSVLRQNTDIVCRYGGEEILVILPNTDLAGASYVAQKIKTAIDNLALSHDFSGVAKQVTVSQGIYSTVPAATGKEIELQFIGNADKALYQAKASGRDTYTIFDV